MSAQWWTRRGGVVALALAIVTGLAVPTLASSSDWDLAVKLPAPVNTDDYTEGCPILSPNGRTLFFASNRPGGQGGLDIWKVHMRKGTSSFGEPRNVGAPVNTAADEFCPSPARHRDFYFVRNPGQCGGPDIFVTRRSGDGSPWDEPANLGCTLNSPGAEFSPSLVGTGSTALLYFSSNGRNGPNRTDQDLYVAARGAYGTWGTPSPLTTLNTSDEDARPNVRADGLEIVFDSTRPGGEGSSDIYSATRCHPWGDFGTAVNLGPAINSTAGESRASLSHSGDRLVFGSTRDGTSDIFTSVRN
jgi:Tol biopolymer transport system component